MSLTRRNFLVYAGWGTYAALATGAQSAPLFPLPRRRGPSPGFEPIAPSTADAFQVPSGFKWNVLCGAGDALGSSGPFGPERFGYNNDLLVYFPIDALTGGKSSDEGLLWVNHENPNPLFVSNYDGKSTKTRDQILAEKLSVGGSVLHIRREGGVWKHVPGSRNRRLTAAYPEMKLSGPAATELPTAVGTLANCSGGRTPWMTVLSCEENYQEYNGINGISTATGYRWSDVPAMAIDDRQYGWVVEVDPFGDLPPMKHSALGRFSHENTAWRLGPNGRLAIYMGDDAADQYLYKYVSAAPYRHSPTRAEKRSLLSEGTLYVAEFAKGRWLPLDLERSPELRAAGFKSQADVLIRCREAAATVKATPIDRPEDCEVHPLDGSVYVALTNNTKHGNLFGQIIRLVEDNDDPEGEGFRFELFLAGGPQSGLSAPDNLAFDRHANLWVGCDISTASLNNGAQKPFGNNGVFVVPTVGPSAGDAFQFASGPVDAELTGPWFSEDWSTLFLAIQHPGELSVSRANPTSRWPDGGDSEPRPCVVAISGF